MPRTLALTLSLVLFATASRGATPAEKSKAEALFKAGRVLVQEGKWADACAAFEESERIDPATGTLLNLGVCHARVGKTATAWAELQASLTKAQEAKRADREQIVRKELAALEPKLSRLKVSAPPGSEATVRVDDAAPPADGLVDPGEHAVVATAPGHQPWTTKVTIGVGETKTVEIPALAPETAPTTVAAPVTPPPTVATATVSQAPIAERPEAERGHGSGRTLGYVIGGVGVASLAVGTYFALRTSSLRSDANSLAAAGDPAAADKTSDARSAQTFARIGLGAGLVGVGVGAVLLLTAHGADETTTSTTSTAWRLAPAVGYGFAGLSLGGGW